MFDKLIDFLLNQLNNITPISVVFQYEKGLRFRFGKVYGECGKGWHFKIPYVDQIQVTNCTETTHTLPAQSITTKDGNSVVVKGMVKYKVVDVIPYFTEVWDAIDAIQDIACGQVKSVISNINWEDSFDCEIDNQITKKLRNQLKRYGIEVIQFTFTDITRTKSLRLFNETLTLG